MKYNIMLFIVCLSILNYNLLNKVALRSIECDFKYSNEKSLFYDKEFISPNKDNMIRVKSGKVHGFLYFKTHITIECKTNKNSIRALFPKIINANIANDKICINDSNIEVDWITNDRANIKLLGCRQQLQVIEVEFGKNITYSSYYPEDINEILIPLES